MRTCPECKKKYSPTFNSLQSVCSIECAIKHAKKDRAKDEKARKLKNKAFDKKVRDQDHGWHVKKLQAEFNKFIRLRDAKEPCISCQRFHEGQIHAGHYRTIGANPELRFEEDNCFAQCSACNNHLSGNLINYRINLLLKIGISRLTWLEGTHETKNYTVPDLKELIALYRGKNKELKKQLELV